MEVADVGEENARFRVECSEVAGGCGTVGESALHNSAVDSLGKVIVLDAGFAWECVVLQPVQQRFVKATSAVRVLWCVDMGVNETWEKELALCCRHFLEIASWSASVERCDDTIIYGKVVVLEDPEFAEVAVDEGSMQKKRFHPKHAEKEVVLNFGQLFLLSVVIFEWRTSAFSKF